MKSEYLLKATGYFDYNWSCCLTKFIANSDITENLSVVPYHRRKLNCYSKFSLEVLPK